VLINVAPVNAAWTSVDPEEVARDVINCSRFGAGMVHLHVRDTFGRLTPDLTAFRKTVELIRKGCDIVIEASTGGVSNLTIEERCAPLTLPEVECASLNVGSVNLGKAVYLNPIDEVRYCVEKILHYGKTPEVEVFELGMIHATLELAKEYRFRTPLLFSLVLGHEGAAPATPEALIALRNFIPPGMLWGITHAHRVDNDIFAAALGLGARTMRVGFEDSDHIDRNEKAVENAPIVAHMAKLLRALSMEPMSPNEARRVFNIGG
jgi:3-keto-5-aminohexanoate cleavage enzyme